MVDVRGLPASRTDNEDLSSIYKIRGKNGGFTSSPGRRSYGLLKQSICNPVFARSTLLISSFTDMPQMNVTGQGSPYPLPRHAFFVPSPGSCWMLHRPFKAIHISKSHTAAFKATQSRFYGDIATGPAPLPRLFAVVTSLIQVSILNIKMLFRLFKAVFLIYLYL